MEKKASCKMLTFIFNTSSMLLSFAVEPAVRNSSGIERRQAAAHVFHETQSLHKLIDDVLRSHSLHSCWAWHLGCLSITNFPLTVIYVKHWQIGVH